MKIAWMACLMALPASAALAQTPAPEGERTTVAALGIEVLGGVVGSALGFGTVVALASEGGCGEDLSCTLGNVAAAVALGTAGAAGGAYGAGRIFHTEPSGWGAVAGAVVGAGAAIGLDHLLTEGRGDLSRAGHVLVFGVAQGTLAGLGSRLGAALRGSGGDG